MRDRYNQSIYLIRSLSPVAGEVKKEKQNHSQLKILWHKKY